MIPFEQTNPSGLKEQINISSSEYVLGWCPTQRRSTGVNNGSNCRPTEPLRDYQHGAGELKLDGIDGGKSYSSEFGRHEERQTQTF